MFQQIHDADGYKRLKDACDLWTAAFFARLMKPDPGQLERIPTTDAVRKALAGQTPQALRSLLLELEDQRFFHWPLEFPEVFAPQQGEAQPGFDVILGNPPWEQIKLQEQEFFAERHDSIATAPNKAARDQLINALRNSDNAADRKLHAEFQTAKHAADAASVFVRGSGRFPAHCHRRHQHLRHLRGELPAPDQRYVEVVPVPFYQQASPPRIKPSAFSTSSYHRNA